MAPDMTPTEKPEVNKFTNCEAASAPEIELAALREENARLRADLDKCIDAMRVAQTMLSYANQDIVPPAVASSNKNAAWHELFKALNDVAPPMARARAALGEG